MLSKEKPTNKSPILENQSYGIEMCEKCDGKGYIIDCCDDICVGQDWCMHGDGEANCPDCDGWGEK